MVKPGGTGKPRLAISARPAPLPPRRLRISARPPALPLPEGESHLRFRADVLDAAPPLRAVRSRPDAGRPDFLFTRVRRDVNLTMEPWLNAPAVDGHRHGGRRKG